MKAIKNKLIAELRHLEDKHSKSDAHLTQMDALEACVLSVALCYCDKAEEIMSKHSEDLSNPMHYSGAAKMEY